MRAARDAGRESADAAIEVAQAALRRRVTRGGRGAPACAAPRAAPAPRAVTGAVAPRHIPVSRRIRAAAQRSGHGQPQQRGNR